MIRKLILIAELFVFVASYGQKTSELVLNAYAEFAKGRYNESVAAFDQLLNEKSIIQNKWVLQKGIAAFKAGNTEVAEMSFKDAVEKGNATGEIWLARLYTSQGSNVKAVGHIKNYLEKSDHPDINSIKKDSAFTLLHGTGEWFDLWQSDWLSPDQEIISEAEFYRKKRNYEKAHLEIESADLYDVGSVLLYVYNSKMYNEEEIPGLALNEIHKAVQIRPDDAEILKLKASYQVDLGKFEDAELTYGKILELEPENFTIRELRVKNALKTGNSGLAMDDIEILTSYFERNDILFLEGKVRYLSGDYLKALKVFNKLMNMEQNPDAELFRSRGLTYFKTGTYKYASQDLSMSLDLEPNDAETNMYMGLSEYQMGNDVSGCYYLNRAKAFGSTEADQYLLKYCK